MKKNISIGIIGDYDVNKVSHPATIDAISHAAAFLFVKTAVTWLPTVSFLTGKTEKALKNYDIIWASSGSPYKSLEGMLIAIKAAREMGKPFFGT